MHIKGLFNRNHVDRLETDNQPHDEAKLIRGRYYGSWRVYGPSDSPYNELLVFCPLDEDGRADKTGNDFLVEFGHFEIGDAFSRGFMHFDPRRILLRRRLPLEDFPVFATEEDGPRGTARYLGPLSRDVLETVLAAFKQKNADDLMPFALVEEKLAALDESKPRDPAPPGGSKVVSIHSGRKPGHHG
ncbi:MAG: hypothetical protein H6867_11080 [Rhodospirillales bacterium]|nr:hypothetical protein [Rhodospirillales bacterium]MCB9996672.1 hypothetical protein [Rhodospirillales bacterium]